MAAVHSIICAPGPFSFSLKLEKRWIYGITDGIFKRIKELKNASPAQVWALAGEGPPSSWGCLSFHLLFAGCRAAGDMPAAFLIGGGYSTVALLQGGILIKASILLRAVPSTYATPASGTCCSPQAGPYTCVIAANGTAPLLPSRLSCPARFDVGYICMVARSHWNP